MKTLILCNGTPPDKKLFEQSLLWADYFIAADGGANTARSLGEPPDVVVGDLDSFNRTDEVSFKIVFKPEQDSNDLEKALDLAIEEGTTQVVVLGATGKRLDHTLKNLSVLKQYNHAFESFLIRDNFGDLLLLPRKYQAKLQPGKQVSLFPLSGTVSGITTEGLKYPLSDERLENGIKDGSSNEVESTPIKITYRDGDLLMFVAHPKSIDSTSTPSSPPPSRGIDS